MADNNTKQVGLTPEEEAELRLLEGEEASRATQPAEQRNQGGVVATNATTTQTALTPEEITELRMLEEQQTPSIESSIPSSGNANIDALKKTGVGVLTEMYRGLISGGAKSLGMIDSALDLTRNIIPGADNPISRAESKWVHDRASDASKYVESIPRTDLIPWTKSVYEMAGETPAMVASLNLLGRLTNLSKVPQVVGYGGGKLAQAAGVIKSQPEVLTSMARTAPAVRNVIEIGMYNALEKYRASPEYATESQKIDQLKQGFKEGATFGTLLEVAPGMAQGFWEVAKTWGGTVASSWLSALIPGGKEVAQSIMKNPNAWNLGFKNVKESSVKAIEQAKFKLDELRLQNNSEIDSIRQRQADTKLHNELRRKDALTAMRDVRTTSTTELKDGTDFALKSRMDTVNTAISLNYNTLVKDTLDDMRYLGENIVTKKSNYGKIVQQAVEDTQTIQGAAASVPSNNVMSELRDVIRKDSPFSINTATGVATAPQTGAGLLDRDAKTVTNMMQVFNNMASSGQVSIGYLTSLKNDLYSLEQKAWAEGKNQLAKFYKSWGDRAADPAKIVASDPVLSQKLPLLAKANKAYSGFMNYYDEISGLGFTQDKSGGLIPNPQKIVDAILKEDSVTIRRIKIAENKAVKEGVITDKERLLPKIQHYVTDMGKANAEAKALLIKLKRDVRVQKRALSDKYSKAIKELSRDQYKERSLEREEFLQNFNSIRTTKDAEYLSVEQELNKNIEFIRSQEYARSVLPQTGTGRVLASLAWITPPARKLFAGSPLGFGGIQVATGLGTSPIIVSNLIKGSSKLAKYIDDMGSSVSKIGATVKDTVLGSNKSKLAVAAGAGAGLSVAASSISEASTLGERNNNPGNLKGNDKWQGMIGKDKQGHVIFDTIENGIRALKKNLNNHKKSNPKQTLKAYMNSYAEENGTKEAQFIANKMGIDINTKLKDIDTEEMSKHVAMFESKMDISKPKKGGKK